MSVNYNFKGLTPANWFALFVGLTPERIAKDEIVMAEFIGPTNSSWFEVEPGKDELHDHLHEQGYVIATQKSYVNSIMMLLMAVMPAPGWGISEKNIDETVRRVLIYQEINGPLASEYTGPKADKRGSYWDNTYVTEEEIRRLVGFEVNYSTVTPTEFRKKLEGWLWENAKNRQYRAKREQEEAAAVSTGG